MKSTATFHRHRILTGLLALAALLAVSGPRQAEASTAANSLIRNTVTVDYKDAANNPQASVTASANITVNLVAATPTLSAPLDQTVDADGTATYTYTITGNANGQDSYDLAVLPLSQSAGISGSTATLSTPSVTLGGTTLAADTNGTDTITVPYDGTSNGTINGIAPGDKIVINSIMYTVDTVDETNGGTTNLATIKLTAAVPAAANSTGSIVGEQQTFTLTVDPGTVLATSDQTITVDITAKDDNSSSTTAAAATDQTKTTVRTANLTATKEVSTDGGSTFVASASAAPGSTLTYRITVTNGGTGVAKDVILTDPAPMFTSYIVDSAKYSTSAGSAYGAGSALTDSAADTDGYSYASDQATYNAGNIAAGASVVLFFQVKID
jgi:uncharacterized repeat protein (TIGR01451 family)